MDVVIPLAGFGKRLRPHTWSRPKPLVAVAGKPMLGHLIDALLPLRPRQFIFVHGWLGEQIADYVAAAYPQLTAQYVEQDELKGQAHALALARPHLGGELVSCFADTLFAADLTGLGAHGEDGCVYVKDVPDPRRFGVAEMDSRGYVARLVEKPATIDNTLVMIGLYYFRRAGDLLAAIDTLMARDAQRGGEFFLADAVNVMLERGARLRTRPVTTWLDCGTAEALLETNRALLDQQPAAMPPRPGVAIVPPVYIAPTATVERAVLGPHVSIGAGTVVRDAIVRDAIIDDGAAVEGALIEHSLIGPRAQLRGRFRRVNFGADSTLAED
ncbi:MAG: NTP transferase domain-containing protein [Chloroflexi bacterium]|nr:NTP transferase domain-containing protein [Chloroflexota bacterium]